MQLLIPFLVLAAKAEFPSEISTVDYDHVVVIPDTHGDYEATVRSLWLAHKKLSGKEEVYEIFYNIIRSAVIDEQAGKSFKDYRIASPERVAVVQLGDLIDRGPYGHLCLFVFKVLPTVLGWRTITLYGNHELMSFLGRSRPGQYIHPKEDEMFGGDTERDLAYARGGDMFEYFTGPLLGLARLRGPFEFNIDDVRSPNTLFVHGGVVLKWIKDNFGLKMTAGTPQALEQMNKKWKEYIDDPSNHGLETLYEEDSVLWTRDMSTKPESEICSQLMDVLRYFEVARIVVGHTPQADLNAKTRCDGRFVLADVKMSRWMDTDDVDEDERWGGNPVAIIMNMAADGKLDSMIAHYTALDTGDMDSSTVLFESAAPAPSLVLKLRTNPKTSAEGAPSKGLVRSGVSLQNLASLVKHEASDPLTGLLPRVSPVGVDEVFVFDDHDDDNTLWTFPDRRGSKRPSLDPAPNLKVIADRSKQRFLPSPSVLDCVYTDAVVSLCHADHLGKMGLIQLFREEPKWSSVEVFDLAQTTGVLPLTDTGYMPSSTDGRRFTFHAGKQHIVPLRQWMRHGHPLNPLAGESLIETVRAIHKAGFKVGLTTGIDPLPFFGIDEATFRVYLINWSKVAKSSRQNSVEHLFETQIVKNELSKP